MKPILYRPDGKRTARPLQLETLESRAMLAGNVLASAEDGHLLVRGDKLGNEIAITSVDGEYTIIGSNGTTINGSAEPFTIENITGNLDIDLGKGDDFLEIGAASDLWEGEANEWDTSDSDGDDNLVEIPGSLLIHMGKGHDELVLFVDVGLGAIVDTGTGNDAAILGSSRIGGNLLVKTGTGDDSIFVADTYAESANFTTGKGSDDVHVQGVAIELGLMVNTGAGEDVLSLGSFVGSQDEDDSSEGDDLAIDADIENGDSALTDTFDGVSVGQNLAVNTGAGRDSVFVSNVSVETEAVFDFGDGDDEVNIDHLDVLDELLARMGAGNDELQITASYAPTATFDGGTKQNTLLTLPADDEFANDIENLKISAFETEVIG